MMSGNFPLLNSVGLPEAYQRTGMDSRTRVAALAVAMISGMSIAAMAETVDGVTVLRGKPPTVEKGGSAGTGSGTSNPPAAAGGYTIDQSGARNALHTGSSNAGGEISN